MSVLYQTTQESGAHKKPVESSIILSLRPIVPTRRSAVRVVRGGRCTLRGNSRGVDLLGNLPGCVCVEKWGKWVFLGPEMREMRDPQNGCQIGPVPLCFDSLNGGTIMTETIRYSFQQLQRHPKVKDNKVCTSINYSDYTVLLDCVLYKAYNSAHTYTIETPISLSPWIRVKSLYMGYVYHVVPSIWVFFLIIAVPQNGSVSESLTHTSGHRLCKSTPRGEIAAEDTER